MSEQPPQFSCRLRHLTIALVISGLLNIVVLALLSYWAMHEYPPTPYCTLKPANLEQQLAIEAHQGGCVDVLAQLAPLSFPQLVERLSQNLLIENGLMERDLALALLVSIHNFDITRALPNETNIKKKRFIKWQPANSSSFVTLSIYPDLETPAFSVLQEFAKVERWPLTAQGLFLHLKNNPQALDLRETFILTPEFRMVELLFNHNGVGPNKDDVLTLLLEIDWQMIQIFVAQQQQLHDRSESRRQKFLLDCLEVGSTVAARYLLENEWDYSIKRLSDSQVAMMLRLTPSYSTQGEHFAKTILFSHPKTVVQQQAQRWLYARFGEPVPEEWNYQAALQRFNLQNTKNSLAVDDLPKFTEDIAIKPLLHAEKNIALAVSPAITKKVVESANVNKRKKAIVHTVQTGDSLWKIANRYKISVNALKKMNKLEANTIRPGMQLNIVINE